MKIPLKTPQEIEIQKKCGSALVSVAKRLEPLIVPGVTTLELDLAAQKYLIEAGVELSFTRVPGYKYATCICINEQAVHTEPSAQKIEEGDVVTVDIGAYLSGFHTDYSNTYYITQNPSPKIEKFLFVGRSTLDAAIAKVQVGVRLGEVSRVIYEGITGAGYHVLKSLTGHGVGHELHEEPYVMQYNDKPIQKTPIITPGMVLAIEVIYSVGTDHIAEEPGQKWSIISADRSLTACFEKTIAITENGVCILT